MRGVAWLLLLGLGLARVALADVTLVPAGGVWKFNDTGADPGGVWVAPGYGDGAWGAGPAELGYGDGDEATVLGFGPDSANKYMTTYFRRTFQVPAAPTFMGYQLRLVRDDGAVVYLNGVEVARSNMPLGAVTATTPAVTATGGAAESAWNSFALPASACVTGTNTLAVEIHQSGPTSSDISFNLELVGVEPSTTTLTRGPYLQNLTPRSAVLRWRTAGPADSVVRFGDGLTSLSRATGSPLAVTEHLATLTGLMPRGTYYYEVGSTLQTFETADSSHTVTTLPVAGTVTPVRLWAIGDCGMGNSNEAAVRDGFFGWNAGRPLDGILLLGDNAYYSGFDAEYQAGVFDALGGPLRRLCVWPSIGNHDAVNADSPTQTGPYYENFTMPMAGENGGVASGTKAYYSFDVGNVHFICLDSADSDMTAGGPMFSWLQADLAATTQSWCVAFWHHPPYTKGSHDSDNLGDSEGRMTTMRQVALPLLEAHGVDLVLCGHSHVYERSWLMDGHYGTSGTFTGAMKLDGGDGREEGDGAYHKPAAPKTPHAGTVYVVSGGGSGSLAANPGLNHPAMLVGLNVFHSLVVEASGSRMDVRAIGTAGTQLDHFTILKDLPTAVQLEWIALE